MCLFSSIYQKALTGPHEFTELKEISCDIYPNISNASANSLFYIYNYAVIQARYPYSLTVSQLSCFLVLYTTAGQCTLQYDDQEYLLPAGSIAFLDCNCGFHIELCNSSTWSYERLYLNSYNLSYYFDQFNLDKVPVLMLKNITEVQASFTKLTDYILHNKYNILVCSMLIDSLVTNLVIAKQTIHEQEQPPMYIHLIKDLFDLEYQRDYNLDQLSKQFKISKYTLARNFVHFIGMSPIEYLINKRITIAKQLLVETELTISEIAIRVGISNTTHFINLFRKRVGVTPLQYRKQTTLELNILNNN